MIDVRIEEQSTYLLDFVLFLNIFVYNIVEISVVLTVKIVFEFHVKLCK